MALANQVSRPGLAMIANCLTPYRVNLHKLVHDAIPEFQIHTLITHGTADFQWKLDVQQEINVHHFGRLGDSPLARIWQAPLYEWTKGGRLTTYLAQNNVVAVIMTGYRYISYLRVIRHCKRNRIPLFVRNDSNIRSERGMSRPKQFVKSLAYRTWVPHVAGFMSMGKLGDQFFTKYGADPGRIYRVPYTPHYDAFVSDSSQELQRFRQKYGLSGDRKLLIYSGRLVPAKRVDLLIDAFSRLAAQRPDWDLLIAGDGNLADELRRRVPAALQPRVIWTGFLELDDLIHAYHASDVLVLPSQREAWAVVVQEAMAAGLAVVASDVVGSAHDLIEDHTSGRLFPSGNCDSLYSALLDVTDPDRLRAYKENSKVALRQWRERTNPVREIRRALHDVGVLKDRNHDATTRPKLSPSHYA